MTRINTTVIMSGADYFANDQQINPYYAEEDVNVAQAIAEHAEIQRLLTEAGVDVIKVSAPNDSQDGVYTANWALVRGDKAVLAHLPSARKSEEEHARKVLEAQGMEVISVPEGLKFSGQGDALPCGDYLFCGSGYRSDVAAQEFAAQQLGYKRIQLQAIPQLDSSGQPIINATSGWADSFYYDIDLALSIIKGPSEGSLGTIAYCREAFTTKSQQILDELQGFDRILISETEAKQAFACNLVSTGESVVMSGNAPKFKTELESRGLIVKSPQITELAKGGGYIRCTTLSLNL